MAGTVTVYSDVIYPRSMVHQDYGTRNVREVVLACVGDAANGTIPDTDIVALSGYTNGPLSGWGISAIETLYGATGPTDNSDLYLRSTDGSDWLAAVGENTIDNAANNLIILTQILFIFGNLILDVNAQEVHSATYKIKLYLVR